MRGDEQYGIEAMPFPEVVQRLADLAVGDLERSIGEEGGDIKSLLVTLTRVFNSEAAIIPRDDHTDVFIDDDQQPWDALIALLAEVTSTHPIPGAPRHHCICLSRREMTPADVADFLLHSRR